MEANLITVARIILVFIVVGLFQVPSLYVRLLASFLVMVVISLDSLDGYVARKLKISSEFGALFDITGDRIVECAFWIYYAAAGITSFWVPMIVISRDFVVDSVRTIAFKQGKTPFGKNTMMKSGLTKFLVSSPYSRSFYGAMKIIIFTISGIFLAVKTGVAHGQLPMMTADGLWYFRLAINLLVDITVITCIIRGLPVLWDGKDILFAKEYPKKNLGME